MTRPLLICTALSSDELRRAARHEEDRRAAMRIHAIAAAIAQGILASGSED